MSNVPAYARLDSYKLGHADQYPQGTEVVYSNFTPRSNKHLNLPAEFKTNSIIWVGIKGFLFDLNDSWNEFFDSDWDELEPSILSLFGPFCGPNGYKVQRLKELHELGYLPICIRSLPEGVEVPIGVPTLVIYNTHKDFGWLTNSLETWISSDLWKAPTAATVAFAYRRILETFAAKTGGNKDFILWQGHDFSVRGMSGIEDAARTGLGHLPFFTGTDNIPAVYRAADVYGGSFIGGSVPATEHSVMCAGGKETELETFNRLLDTYPSGVVSIVSDTWDFWNVLTVLAPALKDKIVSRKKDAFGLAKTVFRPDSGDPVLIICGDPSAEPGSPQYKGAVEVLWDIFGGTWTMEGYRTLNQCVGLIYGDSITPERANEILKRLEAKKFASDNIVFGIGSYTYQYCTRDSLGFAMKATYVVINGEGSEIFKDPVTDSGLKKSAKGILSVTEFNETYVLKDQVSWEEALNDSMSVVYLNSVVYSEDTIDTIRSNANDVLKKYI